PVVADRSFLVRVVGGQVHLVRGGEPAAFGVAGRRQLVDVVEAGPLIPAVARHGQRAVPVRPDRHQAGGPPPDGAVGSGVDLVLAGRSPSVHRVDELLGGVRAHVVHAAEVRSGAGFQPGGAYRERGVVL